MTWPMRMWRARQTCPLLFCADMRGRILRSSTTEFARSPALLPEKCWPRPRRCKPDVTVIHAQKADWKGNVLLWGIIGVQKEAALAAKQVIVTVEERVEQLDAAPNACILPAWVVSAVCEVRRGATPSYAHGYYERDNVFYRAWDQISRNRETLRAWVEKYVLKHGKFCRISASYRRRTATGGQCNERCLYSGRNDDGAAAAMLCATARCALWGSDCRPPPPTWLG